MADPVEVVVVQICMDEDDIWRPGRSIKQADEMGQE
jgi:hypothetical protein